MAFFLKKKVESHSGDEGIITGFPILITLLGSSTLCFHSLRTIIPHMRVVTLDGGPGTFEKKGAKGGSRMLLPLFWERGGLNPHMYRRNGNLAPE